MKENIWWREYIK